ncbi:Multifunctional fusion protein [Tenacibaculum sediminilitoris]
MKYVENIQQVAELQPDYLGFIFYEKSPRNFEGVIPKLPKKIKKVGVFVNEYIEIVVSLLEEYQLEAVQLHGDETVDYIKQLKKYLPKVEIIKVFGIKNEFNFELLKPYEEIVDYFLFDTKGKERGGNGVVFDWQVLQNYKLTKPFFLSGGIGLEEVNELQSFFKRKEAEHCYAIDVNSKFETKSGVKSAEKLKKFKADSHKVSYMKFQPDNNGYYGQFGGAFIPELLYPNVKELEDNYIQIIESEFFQEEYKDLLKHYVGRPSPLYLAKRLSEKYGATIYLKREDLNHTGAHKVNNTIGQILIAKQLGKTKIIAETGAGQHGVATATVCALMGLECVVFMGETDIKRQAPNVARMKMLGAKVVPATSGSKTLKDATNEAIRYWIQHPDTYYLIGSVVGPHPYPDMVTRLQAVISEEMKVQLKEQTGKENPNTIIACVGGGSNAAGAFYHYLDDEEVELIAVEAAGLGVNSGESAATSQLGEVGVIHGSKTILMQDDYGQIVEPYSISAGLDYPGVGPLHAYLHETKRAKFMNATDKEALEAAYELTKIEGIIPALESAHALAVLPKMDLQKDQVVVVNLSGRGDKDLETYIKYLK